MTRRLLLALLGLFVLAALGPGQDPADRDLRRRNQPGLLIDPGGRFGSADVLQFSADGRLLYAGGDDKVLHRWEVDAAGRPALSQHALLCWAVYRQKRGSIYALAQLPQGRVAVAGFGAATGAVVVLDRDGKVVASLEKRSAFAVWALAASADGKRLAVGHHDGEVRLWVPQTQELVVLGKHGPAGRPQNGPGRVLWVGFESDGAVLSAGEDGAVRRWRVGKPGEVVLQFKRATVPSKVAVSADGKWIAAGGSRQPAESPDTLAEVRSLADPAAPASFARLDDNLHVQCLALNADGSRLAVGAFKTTFNPKAPKEVQLQAFQDLASGPVFLLDPRQPAPALSQIETTFFPEVLAFHPDGKYLAVAGGANHETTLWKLDRAGVKPERAHEVVGRGRSLWSIAFDRDNPLRFGVQSRRLKTPPHPDDQGAGPWHVFDLKERQYKPAAGFTPAGPRTGSAGWEVHFGRPSPTNPASVQLDYRTWYAVSPAGDYLPLPLSDEDGLPRCYSFLPARGDGKVRLVVGHFYGYTLFEIDPAGKPTLRRVRAGQGHDGEVFALAPSADGKLLLTAGRDATVCCWDLDSTYASGNELGATFALADGKVVATGVDAGSPVADAGLQKGDEVVAFFYDRDQFAYDPADPAVRTTAAQCLARLRSTEPNRDHLLVVRRGNGPPLAMRTGARRFPVWRFLPLFDRGDRGDTPADWVIYRFRDYYYDASANGALHLGWQVNGAEAGVGGGGEERTPTFYTAELWHRRFHRPDKIQEVLARPATLPDAVAITRIEPPRVDTTAPATPPPSGPLPVGLVVTPRGTDRQPGDVSLWVNGARVRTWKAGTPVPATVDVERKWLRSLSENHLELVADSADGTTRAAQHLSIGPAAGGSAKPRVFAVVVGIGDYSKVRELSGAEVAGNLLFPVRDARKIRDLCEALGADFRADGSAFLTDFKATTAEIKAALARVAEVAGPDDRVVVFYSGHGAQVPAGPGVPLPQRFSLVTYDTNARRLGETGLDNVELAGLLAQIRGHKLVLLDACHSGGLAVDPNRRDATVHQIRALMPDGVGPAIVTASDFRHESLESEKLQQGVFTAALLESVEAAPPGTPLSVLAARVVERVQGLSRQAATAAGLPGFEQVPVVRIPRNEAGAGWFHRPAN